jgi:CHASE3 domain sensor protein
VKYIDEVNNMNAAISGLAIIIFFLISMVPTVVVLVLLYSVYKSNKNLAQTNRELLGELSALKDRTANIEKLLRDVE